MGKIKVDKKAKPVAKPATTKGPARPATAVATRASTAVAMPMDLDKAIAADAGTGFEEASRDAFAIPFLTILQDLSPQVKSKMDGYIEGAKPGMIYNSVTQDLYDGDSGIWVIPCHWSQVFIEWVPRDKGGGFVGAYPPGHPKIAEGIRAEKGGGLMLPNGNQLMDTRQHFVLVLDDDGRGEGALIPFKSTGLKLSRRWMSQMRSALIEINGKLVEPPMFAHQYRLTVEEGANDQGSWYQFNVAERQRVTDPSLYQQAKAFGAAMRAGSAKVNYEEMHGPSGLAGGDPAPADLDDNVVED